MNADAEFGDSARKVDLARLVAIVGKWNIDEKKAEFIRYDNASFKIGVALSDVRCTAGDFAATVELAEVEEGCAHFVLGHDPENMIAFTVGIGGFDRAYSISEYYLPRRSRMIHGIGQKENLRANRKYRIEVQLRGQNVKFSVDGTRVFEHTLPHPLYGDQFGIKGYGEGTVTFTDVEAHPRRPRAFVVMQFSEPYDSLYAEVIKPVADRVGYEAYRADDVLRPGIILQDIVRGIAGSDVIIAEVTPQNANVFYELGFAHALSKPTILLAEHPKEGGVALPFDISGFRCIFYDDAIRGKSKVESALERHLRNIREGDQEAIVTE